jgi:hypothetical protein
MNDQLRNDAPTFYKAPLWIEGHRGCRRVTVDFVAFDHVQARKVATPQGEVTVGYAVGHTATRVSQDGKPIKADAGRLKRIEEETKTVGAYYADGRWVKLDGTPLYPGQPKASEAVW